MVWYGPISIGIFAPQFGQAKTDFDRLKIKLDMVTRSMGEFNPDEKNANTLRIPNGSECYIFPVTPTSNPESKTLDLILVEEGQAIDDHNFSYKVRPMGAARNGVFVWVGSGGYNICYYYRLLQKPKALIYDAEKVIAQKREVYNRTGDSFHLNYERFVSGERDRIGDTDEFKAAYLLQWILGAGQFITSTQFQSNQGTFSQVQQDLESNCWAGIDTAKHIDSTVVTVVRERSINVDGVGLEPRRELINWLELKGDNYEDQFEAIVEFLKKYKVRGIAIDATGQGDFMPDKFERHTKWRDELSGLFRIKFSLVSKDAMYKNLSVVIQNCLTLLPKTETKEAERFKQQLLDLQKEYRGELLNCKHPNSPDAHDDYADSWALAEYAYALWSRRGEPNARVITINDEPGNNLNW